MWKLYTTAFEKATVWVQRISILFVLCEPYSHTYHPVPKMTKERSNQRSGYEKVKKGDPQDSGSSNQSIG